MSQMPDDSEVPLVKQVPPANIASPSELHPRSPGDVRWYMPSLADTARLLGWRWIFFLPAALLIILLCLVPWKFWILQIVIASWKLVVIAVAFPASYAVRLSRNILRSRKEPFCIHCGYDLTGLPDNYVCPECGEPYNFRIIEEYKRDPHWFIQRYRMHGDLPVRDEPFEARKSSRPRSKDGT